MDVRGTVKKVERWRIDAFELWCWRRLLQVPWRSNQSILKETSPGCSLETETPILWPPHEKSWLIGKGPDAGRDWGQEEKGMTENEMAGYHHWLDAYEFGWTPGVGDGLGGLVCYNSWGSKESDTTERLNWTEEGVFGDWLKMNLKGILGKIKMFLNWIWFAHMYKFT